jgi:hypothetical protein
MLLPHLARDLDAVHIGQADIEHQHIRVLRLGHRDRLAAGRSLADDHDVGLAREQRAERLAHHALIFGKHHSDGHE